MINHSFTKSMLFFATGSILHRFGTNKIDKVKGVLKVLPVTGTAFYLGLFAIAGVPPFSIFASELGIVVSIFVDGRFIIGSAFILLLAVIFTGIALNLFKMFYSDGPEPEGEPLKINPAGTVAIMLLLLVIFTTGFYMPEGLRSLIYNAQMIIMGVK